MITLDILMFLGLIAWTIFVAYVSWKACNFFNDLNK